jgi:hypothetical protein
MLDSTGSIRSAVEALFRLEHSRTPDDMREVVRTLVTPLRDPQHETIRRDFTAWIKRLLRRKTTSSTIGEIEHINDLLENGIMLAERIGIGFNEAKHNGIQVRRFGLLPLVVSERLAHATPTELERWGETVLIAPREQRHDSPGMFRAARIRRIGCMGLPSSGSLFHHHGERHVPPVSTTALER